MAFGEEDYEWSKIDLTAVPGRRRKSKIERGDFYWSVRAGLHHLMQHQLSELLFCRIQTGRR